MPGYSWLTNQYGLTVDNLVAIELVAPDGAVTRVDSGTRDLWYALRVSFFFKSAYSKGCADDIGNIY